MSELQVGLQERSYRIRIESGCLQGASRDIAARFSASRYCIVTDETVAELYGRALRESFLHSGSDCDILTFSPGEKSKNLATVGSLASGAARAGLDRKGMIIALGGGVAGDIAGFLASAFMRGIPFVQIPTSLLAQVDSSVGGKTGVDIPEGKNLVGAFYQPLAVYIDPAVLVTLPRSEYLAGLAEVIKYGVISEPEFLTFLTANHGRIMALDDAVVTEMVHTCCRIKAEVVAGDEREADRRRILNYGHTIGHAVEAASHFAISHGFAVAIGMVAAARISVLQARLSAGRAEEITSVIRQYQLPTEVPKNLDRSVIKSYLLTDKKNIGGRVFYVLPTDRQGIIITDDVSEELIDRVLDF